MREFMVIADWVETVDPILGGINIQSRMEYEFGAPPGGSIANATGQSLGKGNIIPTPNSVTFRVVSSHAYFDLVAGDSKCLIDWWGEYEG
jgi:hypothetical protein